MTAERAIPRKFPRNLNAVDLVARAKRKSVEFYDKTPQGVLNELIGLYHIKIPDRLTKKMEFGKLNWYKVSPPMSMQPEDTIAYLGFYGKRSRKNMDLENARMVIVRDASNNTRSLRLFGNIKDSSGVDRVIALTYSMEDYHLTSAGFSLTDVDKALNLMVGVERFRKIPSINSRDVLVTPAMVDKTESRRFSRISGFIHEHHSYLVTVDDMEIRRQLIVDMGFIEDHATILIGGRFRDYHFDFRHAPSEGRINLGNWKISVPKKLS